MARLEEIPVEDLEDALGAVEGYREARRLLVAIVYKRGPSVPMLAEWLDVREATMYRWFDRLEDEPIAEAIRDDPRPGRPPKLDDDQLAAFRNTVAGSPAAAGYEGETWTADLARQYLEGEFGVAYSTRHVRRMLGEMQEDESQRR
jgi:transposase